MAYHRIIKYCTALFTIFALSILVLIVQDKGILCSIDNRSNLLDLSYDPEFTRRSKHKECHDAEGSGNVVETEFGENSDDNGAEHSDGGDWDGVILSELIDPNKHDVDYESIPDGLRRYIFRQVY